MQTKTFPQKLLKNVKISCSDVPKKNRKEKKNKLQLINEQMVINFLVKFSVNIVTANLNEREEKEFRTKKAFLKKTTLLFI